MSLPADFLSGEAILLHYQWSGRRRAEGVYPNDGDSGTDKGLPSYRGISLNDQDWHIRGQNPFSVMVRLRCEQACARHALRARRQAPAAFGSRLAENSSLLRGQPRRPRKSSREPSRRCAHSYANTCLSCCFKRAPGRLPAKMPAALPRCSGQRRTLTDSRKT